MTWKKLLVLMLVIGLLLTALSGVAFANTASSPGTTKTPIRHAVFIMMENHSFDSLFGTYPFHRNLTATVSGEKYNMFPSSTQLSKLHAVPNGTYSTPDPLEGYSAYHMDWNNGKMNGFLNNSGPASLYYFNVSQMSLEWDIAREFSMGAMYFSSTLSETIPNRLYSLAGYSPVINDYGPPPYIPLSSTIFGELNSYNVSWGYYVKNPADGTYVLPFIQGLGSHSSNIRSWSTFTSEVSSNTLPSVSWVSPISGGVTGYSQHPPDNVFYGEQWLLYIINAIMHSPEWNSTAIFITYDEGGGFYDSVPPPVVAGNQLGFRVPFIVVSPYAKENYVSTTVLSHTSLISFVDYNWNIPPLNRLVAFSNIPLDMFDFTAKYQSGAVARPPLNMSAIGQFIPDELAFPQIGPNGSIASAFPLQPQFNLSTLPYQETGSSSDNMSNVTDYFAGNSTDIVPFYNTTYFLSALLIAAIAIPSIIIRYGSRVRK